MQIADRTIEPVALGTQETYTSNPLRNCGWHEFKVIHDARGNLSVVENFVHIPFEMKRIYFLFDVPAMAERAGHGHRNLTQVFIPMSGSFDLHLDDGIEKRSVHLSRPNRGYLVHPWTWRTLDNFSGNSVCLVLASTAYDEEDYIRTYADFQRLVSERKGLYF